MKINDTEIMLSKEDRKMLKKFFSDNYEFITNNSFIEYENIKLLGDLYEKFIDENNLRENDILMLFLAQIRYDQLAFKITYDSPKMLCERLFAVPKNRLNDTIYEWYYESRVSGKDISLEKVNARLEKALRQNRYERQKSLIEADKYIF